MIQAQPSRRIEELTDGGKRLFFYGGGSLGTTSEVLEGMKFGVANVMCESTVYWQPFTPMANIDATPYLFRDYDHFMETWNSDVGEEIKETVGEESGFKLLGGTGSPYRNGNKGNEKYRGFPRALAEALQMEMYLETQMDEGSTYTHCDDRNLYSFAAEDER